ncbi:SpoIIE family protein phosphatase/ATP-binding protein [Streptomyces pacificus]|uniref:protein-serine/threonine phosphatase n=1 Tax=Streptomyces pacificus TaxID=2705029 RepID=A0A6A0ANL8_9ACTN|nr:SpoIIE family protein phosphatase/ATP-binding protein [Streptomyces pacificus]GFH34566.1 SpoIIE family protein phosphatase [Streptomyces pacificus]
MIGRPRRSWLTAVLPSDRPRTPGRLERPGWRGRLRSLLDVHSLATQVFLLQALVILLLVVAATVALALQARHDSYDDARSRSLAAAEAFAYAPGTAAALESPDPGAALQPTADMAQRGAGVDFISVLSKDGVRYTDPDPQLIGRRVAGDISRAAAGEAFTETFEGDPQDAVRAVVPVPDSSGRVVGLVAAGIQVENVGELLHMQLPIVLGSAVGALLLATGGAALVSRRLRRQTHGLGPAEMTRMYEHHDAVLHAVREGVLIIGGDGRLLLANDEARRLLDLPADADRRPVTELGLGPGITGLLVSGTEVSDEVFLSGDRLLAVNTRPTAPYGGVTGLVASLRDTTELRALSGRAEVARERLTLLYEAGVRIGTTLDVRRTARELADVAVPRFADFVTVELLDPVLRGDEPSGLGTMRRTALSGIAGDHPLQPVGDAVRTNVRPMSTALARGRALLEPDLAASATWGGEDPEGRRRALEYGIRSLITVPLQARGAVLGLVNYWRAGGTPRFDEDDTSFAEELAARAAVAIDNARRYTREHAMAVTLQRSLLPRDLPEQDALEVAWRYLPARAGVGGDWFDVIPLPGFRVALVVGDVVGHGMHAAATMGRLRTAVLNFSSLDMPPADLVARLDDLVLRIDADQPPGTDGERAPVTGATCLYAIYDPVGGHCTLAHAGHPAPAIVDPGGRVVFPELPVSPPLGVGGHPFDETGLDLAEGSRLVLFTDGLIEDRSRDIDEGLAGLRDALARSGQTPEETCSAVTDALLPGQPSDDIALLVARTRLLDRAGTAEWDVPLDLSAVSRVRAEAGRRISEWGLADSVFVAELVLGELLTNAMRYGAEPVHVRLLLGRTLVVEVSDGSSTSPHLRRAAATDEGGRGLFLVAQFSQRWGTRYVGAGKIIWAELALGAGPPGEAVMAPGEEAVT